MKLLCAYCNELKDNVADFPLGHYAECWTCYAKRRKQEIEERILMKRWMPVAFALIIIGVLVAEWLRRR